MLIFFLMLFIVMSIPLNVVSFVFGLKIRNKTRPIAVIIPIVGIALIASAFIGLITSAALTPNRAYDDDSASTLFLWISVGLSTGAFVNGVAAIIVVFILRSRYLASLKQEPKIIATSIAKENKASANSDSTGYIKEIKELKELLDSGAITQEEFDKKKKELLER